MSFTRPYELTLRVFEPVAAHPELHHHRITDNRERIDRALQEEADQRLLVLPPQPMPPATPDRFLFLPAAETDDGIDRVSPLQQHVLSWEAIRELEDSVPVGLLDPLVPRSVRREASMERMDWQRKEVGDDHVYSQVSAWHVPFQWWLAFDSSVDHVIEDEVDGRRRIRMRAEIMSASARVDWARDVLRETTPPGGPVEIVGRFAEWLDGFDFNSIVELDLGGLSAVQWESDLRSSVDDCVSALADNDSERATEAFAAYMRGVDHLRLESRAS